MILRRQARRNYSRDTSLVAGGLAAAIWSVCQQNSTGSELLEVIKPHLGESSMLPDLAPGIVFMLVTIVVHSGAMLLVMRGLPGPSKKSGVLSRWDEIGEVSAAVLIMFFATLIEVVIWAIGYLALDHRCGDRGGPADIPASSAVIDPATGKLRSLPARRRLCPCAVVRPGGARPGGYVPECVAPV